MLCATFQRQRRAVRLGVSAGTEMSHLTSFTLVPPPAQSHCLGATSRAPPARIGTPGDSVSVTNVRANINQRRCAGSCSLGADAICAYLGAAGPLPGPGLSAGLLKDFGPEPRVTQRSPRSSANLDSYEDHLPSSAAGCFSQQALC